MAKQNKACQRVAVKGGYKKEGILTQMLFVEDKCFDCYLYSKIPWPLRMVGKASAILLRGLALYTFEIAQVCSNSNADPYSHSHLHRRSAALSTYRICHRYIPCRRYSPCNYASSCLPAFLQGYKAVPECRERQWKAFPTGYLLLYCIRKFRTPIPASAF